MGTKWIYWFDLDIWESKMSFQIVISFNVWANIGQVEIGIGMN
jgi:hypothetical protein